MTNETATFKVGDKILVERHPIYASANPPAYKASYKVITKVTKRGNIMWRGSKNVYTVREYAKGIKLTSRTAQYWVLEK